LGAQLVDLPDLGIEPGLELEMSLLGFALVAGVIASLLRGAFASGEEEEQA